MTACGSSSAADATHARARRSCARPRCGSPSSSRVVTDPIRRWLETRYGSLAELNRVWGTAFWGQRYGSFDQIAPPRRTPASVNPTQALDWRRFCSDAFLACYEAERDVLVEMGCDLLQGYLFGRPAKLTP